MATIDVFPKRLTDLRKNKGLKRQQVADDLGITRASLEYYEKGKRKPDIEMTAKIAKYFQVSVDYLLGLSDVPKNRLEYSDYVGLSKEEEQILKRAITLYGENSQTDMIFEEMSELEKALLKYRRAKNADYAVNLLPLLNDIYEEIADVEIMLTQCRMLFRCDLNVEVQKRKKIQRLAERLAASE